MGKTSGIPNASSRLDASDQVGERAAFEQLQRLAVRLGMPIYGCDPALLAHGSKSGSRKIFREASSMSWDGFRTKIKEMGAIVEAFIEGRKKRSPSGRYRIDPTGHLEVISTHDQVLGGGSGQIFLDCSFPADRHYRLDVAGCGKKSCPATARPRCYRSFRYRLHFRAEAEGLAAERSIDERLDDMNGRFRRIRKPHQLTRLGLIDQDQRDVDEHPAR